MGLIDRRMAFYIVRYTSQITGLEDGVNMESVELRMENHIRWRIMRGIFASFDGTLLRQSYDTWRAGDERY